METDIDKIHHYLYELTEDQELFELIIKKLRSKFKNYDFKVVSLNLHISVDNNAFMWTD